MFTAAIERFIGQFDTCPWGGAVGNSLAARHKSAVEHRKAVLYSPDERRRRDASKWTMVQGVMAPAQFAVFLVSLALVLRFLLTGNGEAVTTASILLKTCVLYAIMVTGSIWEREVFGRYLFAPAFFWEDAVSMVVLGLHTAYVAALLSGALDSHHLMLLALAAYATYVVNAAQFVVKLRMARREQPGWQATMGASA